MDKKSKDIIKDTIYFLLKLRTNHLLKNIDFGNEPLDPYMKKRFINEVLSDYQNNGLENIVDKKNEYIDSMDTQLIKLNSLLEKADKVKEVIDIEMQMKKIQAKKYISVKEFTEIYGKSSDWQRNRRGRIRNKLPFMQEKSGSNVMYKVEDIEVWFQNNS